MTLHAKDTPTTHRKPTASLSGTLKGFHGVEGPNQAKCAVIAPLSVSGAGVSVLDCLTSGFIRTWAIRAYAILLVSYALPTPSRAKSAARCRTTHEGRH